tara:strand:+ start:577 stop:1248 length:672 start_codon:yes stop_codon:yes gene_type:complete
MAKELRPLVDALQIVSDIAKGVAGILTGISAGVVTIGAKIFQALVVAGGAGVKLWKDMKKGYNEDIAPLIDHFKENWKTIVPLVEEIFTLIEVGGKAVSAAMTFASEEIVGPIQAVYRELLLPVMSEIEDFISYVEGSTIMGIYNDATKAKDNAIAGETNTIGSMVGFSGVSDKEVVMQFTNKIDVSGVTDRTSKESLAKDIAKILQKNIRTSNFSLIGGKLA